MAADIQVIKYTEYTTEISGGQVITQVPEESDMPIQIIYKTGTQVILKLDELDELNAAVRASLKLAGWEEKKEGG
jgi:hypothetical protein